MPIYKLTVNLTQDGNPVDGFPYVGRLNLVEGQTFATTQASGSSFVAIPSQLATVNLLVFTADQQVALDFNNATSLTLLQNGLLLAFNCQLNSGATTNCTAQNNSGSTANLIGLVGGP